MGFEKLHPDNFSIRKANMRSMSRSSPRSNPAIGEHRITWLAVGTLRITNSFLNPWSKWSWN